MRRGIPVHRAWATAAVPAALLGLAVLLGLAGPGLAGARGPATAAAAEPSPAAVDDSVRAGYAHLAAALDRAGTGPRLPASYTGGYLERIGFTASVTYDDALVVLALLARRTGDDLGRAVLLGDALLHLQATDPAGDGRLRGSYRSGPLPDGPAPIADAATTTGVQAWAGLALLRLHAATGDPRYLAGAVRLGDWLTVHVSAPGRPGFTGGYAADGARLTYRSTEHNVDAYAFLTGLAARTGDPAWQARADSARGLLAEVWHAPGGHFHIGTLADGVTPNPSPLVADAQTWAYLALRGPAYAGALDWTARELSARDGRFRGIGYSSADRSKVWFEGTAHLALALRTRGAPGDDDRAAGYLETIRLAQRSAPNADGAGIVAASRDGLRTGDGGSYYASLHTGATAWYLLAAQRVNPLDSGA
jgi:hypothetical protein